MKDSEGTIIKEGDHLISHLFGNEYEVSSVAEDHVDVVPVAFPDYSAFPMYFTYDTTVKSEVSQ